MSIEQTIRRGRPSGYHPRGAIVRRMRVSQTDSTADGIDRQRTVSGSGIILTVTDDSQSRRTLKHLATLHAVILTRLTPDRADGEFRCRSNPSRHLPGERPRAEYQAVGDVAALEALTAHPCVVSWHFAVAVRVPVLSGGNGIASERTTKAIRDAKRESGERFADVERAERRPFTADAERDQLRTAARALGIDPSDTVRLPMLAELIRLAGRAADLTDTEASRVTQLRSMLGI